MDYEIQILPCIEKFLHETMYPGIKLHRTVDLYGGDRFMHFDFESDLTASKRRILIEFKSVKNSAWSYNDQNEFVDLLSIVQGDALRAFDRFHGHCDCFLFVCYVPHNQLMYTRINRLTTMVASYNYWLEKPVYALPKSCFTLCPSIYLEPSSEKAGVVEVVEKH